MSRRATLFAKGTGYAGLSLCSILGGLKILYLSYKEMKVDYTVPIEHRNNADLVARANAVQMVKPVVFGCGLGAAACVMYINYKFKLLQKSWDCFKEAWSQAND